MMFKTLLAKIGKGGAQIDLILDKDQVHLGDQVKGKLLLRGGIIDQKIQNLAIDLMLHIRMDQQVHSFSVARFLFHSPCSVHPSEEITLPFSYQLPFNLLVSGYTVSYQFVTRLDIVAGTTHTQTNPVIITPPPSFQHLLNALEQLGFHEKYGSRTYDGRMQSFEFIPTSFLKKEVRELEMIVAIGNETVSLFVELPFLSNSPGFKSCREIKLKRKWLDEPDRLRNLFKTSLWEMVQYPEYYKQNKKSFYTKHLSCPGAIGAFAGDWFDHSQIEAENTAFKENTPWAFNQTKA